MRQEVLQCCLDKALRCAKEYGWGAHVESCSRAQDQVMRRVAPRLSSCGELLEGLNKER